MHFLFPELERHVAVGNALGEALRDSRLAYARFAYQTGVVFLAAVENLYDALNLLFASDDRVKFALLGAFGQANAIVVEELPARRGLFPVLTRFALPIALRRRGRRVPVRVIEQAVHKRKRRRVALLLLFLVVVLVVHVVALLHGGEHIRTEGFKILVANADTLHHLVDLRQSGFAGATEAQALTGRLIAFQFGDKDHGDIFLTSAA